MKIILKILILPLFVFLSANITAQNKNIQQLKEILSKAVDNKLIEPSFKDSVEMFIKEEIVIQKPLNINTGIRPLQRGRMDILGNSPYIAPNATREKMTKMDYFSIGIDGYYEKMIAIGFTGQGWTDTKEAREAIDRIRADMDMHLADVRRSSTPDFLKRMVNSNNPFKKIIGNFLMILHSGTYSNIQRNNVPPNNALYNNETH